MKDCSRLQEDLINLRTQNIRFGCEHSTQAKNSGTPLDQSLKLDLPLNGKDTASRKESDHPIVVDKKLENWLKSEVDFLVTGSYDKSKSMPHESLTRVGTSFNSEVSILRKEKDDLEIELIKVKTELLSAGGVPLSKKGGELGIARGSAEMSPDRIKQKT